MKGSEIKVTSTDIKKALAQANYKNYFITECKTCSTYFPDPQGLLKFDGLAISKSYTKPCITGYEVKVSRGDFLQDNKWHLYLQYCNEFYFVVPSGMITKEEIPENVGLIYYNPENGALRTKRKALYREIEEPIGVYKYIIYSRLDQDRIPFYERRAEYAEAYLKDKSEKRQLGSAFGSKMATDLMVAQEKLKELERSKEKLELFEKIMELLHRYGIIWSKRYYDTVLQNLEKALSHAYPKELEQIEGRLQGTLDELVSIRKRYENQGEGKEHAAE